MVKISDRIAYINHDIDDALRAGKIRIEELPYDCLEILGRKHSERINTMVRDTILHSTGKPRVSMSSEVGEATQKLRDFLFNVVYMGIEAQQEESKARFIIEKIFRLVLDRPELVSGEHGKNIMGEREAADFVAGMTDRYAIRFFSSHFLPMSVADLG